MSGHWDQCDHLVEAVYDAFGQCDILVNNAGLSPLYESLYEVTEDLYDKVMSVNLKGPFRLSAAFGKRMYDAGMDEFNKRAQEYPLQRGGEADEIVGAALYFASDASSYTIGAVLKIDGGAVWSPG